MHAIGRWAALVAGVLALGACGVRVDPRGAERAAALTGGDPARGRTLMRAYGCQACHTIPGVDGADSRVGPPLGGVAARLYIAGVLPTTPENLVRWLQDPPAVDPLTAMPDLGVSQPHARDMAAYLYSLP